MEEFGVDSRARDGAVIVTVAGAIDLSTAGLVEHRVCEALAAGCRSLVLDLSGVSFIDSSGLRAVLVADQSCRAADAELALVRGPATVQRVFQITGTERHLRFLDAGVS
jgi:anti-anti-sigma factor